jgi:signal transduction histidine kinase
LGWLYCKTKQVYFTFLTFVINHQSGRYNYKPLLLNKNIALRIGACVGFVSADQDSLKIIRNVLDNAVKFSKENGAIAIYTRF